MQNFQLSAYLIISGIGAASGIIFKENNFYIISDNSGYLYQYQIEKNILLKHALIENPSENIIKKLKPDFESITQNGDSLHIFGSGSTKNRNKNIIFNTKSQKTVSRDLTDLYTTIKKSCNISDEDFNLEGTLFYNKKLYIFQRGNSEDANNGIFIIDQKNESDFSTNNIEFIPVKLPKINNISATFTDAIRVENKIYFLAAAENTKSTYDDGEVSGSILGCMNIDTFEIDYTLQISNSHKFEGIALDGITNKTIEFFLCEDNDTEQLETTIYKLTVNK